MKFFQFALAAILAVCAILLASCASTSLITEYDQTGAVVKTIETKESVAKVIAGDLKDKTVVAVTDGWGAKVSVGAQVESGLTPSLDMRAGKFGIFYGSFQKDMPSAQIADIVRASKEPLTISPAGICSGKNGVQLPAEPLKQGEDLGKAFTCNGKSCKFADLSAHTSVAYLRNVTDALLAYDGSKTMPETGETYADTLRHFSAMLDTYDRYGVKESKVAILRASVEDGTITDLMYCAWDMEGGRYEVQCPNCAPWEPEGYEE